MEVRVATITHYYDHIHVAVLSLNDQLKVGDTIHIHGHSTDFTQQVDSIEIEHKKVQSVGPGQEAALQMAQPVHEKDLIYKVVAEVK
jgi:putative protease